MGIHCGSGRGPYFRPGRAGRKLLPGASRAEVEAAFAAWLELIGSRTPEGDAELTAFVRAALSDPEDYGDG